MLYKVKVLENNVVHSFWLVMPNNLSIDGGEAKLNSL